MVLLYAIMNILSLFFESWIIIELAAVAINTKLYQYPKSPKIEKNDIDTVLYCTVLYLSRIINIYNDTRILHTNVRIKKKRETTMFTNSSDSRIKEWQSIVEKKGNYDFVW